MIIDGSVFLFMDVEHIIPVTVFGGTVRLHNSRLFGYSGDGFDYLSLYFLFTNHLPCFFVSAVVLMFTSFK